MHGSPLQHVVAQSPRLIDRSPQRRRHGSAGTIANLRRYLIMYLNTVGPAPARKLVTDDIFGNDTAPGQK
jgi:hypothetical protein